MKLKPIKFTLPDGEEIELEQIELPKDYEDPTLNGAVPVAVIMITGEQIKRIADALQTCDLFPPDNVNPELN